MEYELPGVVGMRIAFNTGGAIGGCKDIIKSKSKVGKIRVKKHVVHTGSQKSRYSR